jgi:hypothetical protein
VHLREAAGFPACPFCGVGLALDRTGVRPHVLYRPRVTPTQILPLLRRWADRHGVATALSPLSPRLIYYPFWRYALEGPRRLVPAWSTLDAQWEELRLPDAEQVFFDASHVQGAGVVEPTIPEAAARARVFGEAPAQPGDLVHLPVYEATIRVGGLRQRVAVEACAGAVVCSAGGMSQRTRVETVRHAWWMAGGGLVVLVAAATIRPLGIAAIVVAFLAALLYGALLGEGRRSGA